jgi:hypothetical protein
MNTIVHNQHPDIELVSPVYFCNCGIYNEHPVKRTDAGAMMNVGFRFDLDNLPSGILMYEVQKEGKAKSDHQPSIDIVSTQTAKDTSKMMRLLVAWKIEQFEEPRIHIVLLEHDNELVLNEDKLVQLYKVNDQFSRRYNSSKSTWLVSANTVLEAAYEVVQKEGIELKITISEGAKDNDTKSALWIDSERQVSSLMIIYFVLIYIVSLTLQSIMNVIINNRCPNIELTSPLHFTKDATCHAHLPQQIDSKNRMKINFKAGVDRDTFGGALLYYLRKKENDESDHRSDNDISLFTQLLMIWEFRIDRLYSHAWLIEHESTLIWSEDMLKRLYEVYNGQCDADINAGSWLLDDSTKLQTMCEISHGGFEMKVTISEEKCLLHPTKPLWVNSNR